MPFSFKSNMNILSRVIHQFVKNQNDHPFHYFKEGLSHSYFKEYSIVHNQIYFFNKFINEELPKIIKNIPEIEISSQEYLKNSCIQKYSTHTITFSPKIKTNLKIIESYNILYLIFIDSIN